MNVLRRIVVGLAGIVVVALVMELAAPKAVHALVSTLVTVSNTTAQPVPTMAVDTRNVNVVGTPSVNVNSLPTVQLSGTPTVNINSMPPVSTSITGNVPVTNPLDGSGNPIPLVTQNPVSAANAFDVTGACNTLGNGCSGSIYPVPAGKMAVMQSASWTCPLPPNVNVYSAFIDYTTPSEYTVPSEAGVDGRVYLEPGPWLPVRFLPCRSVIVYNSSKAARRSSSRHTPRAEPQAAQSVLILASPATSTLTMASFAGSSSRATSSISSQRL